MQHLSHPRNLRGLAGVFTPLLPEDVSLDVHAGSVILRRGEQVLYTKRIMSLLSKVPDFTIADYDQILREMCQELTLVMRQFQPTWPCLGDRPYTLTTAVQDASIDLVLVPVDQPAGQRTLLGAAEF